MPVRDLPPGPTTQRSAEHQRETSLASDCRLSQAQSSTRVKGFEKGRIASCWYQGKLRSKSPVMGEAGGLPHTADPRRLATAAQDSILPHGTGDKIAGGTWRLPGATRGPRAGEGARSACPTKKCP
jgi:hypothetical protein